MRHTGIGEEAAIASWWLWCCDRTVTLVILLCRRLHTGGRTRCCCSASPSLLPQRQQLFKDMMQQDMNMQRSLLSKSATAPSSPASLCKIL